ncbi:SH3 domain-containing protein [Bacillus sp. JJ722]|uniref:SH3 domain-containing protein n=1 Tax=Bacillus sp. JJ722 TaxID=3122973 RepID=UPI002FFD82CF
MYKKMLTVVVAFVLMIALFSPFASKHAAAFSPQVGTIDITKGSLQIHSGAGTKYPVVGTLKRSDQVKVYSQTKSGWSEIRHNKKKAYVSSKYVRFYKRTSLNSVKQIHDKIRGVERQAIAKPVPKATFYKMMSPAFTKYYIDRYFKQEMVTYTKDRYGNPLYEHKATDFTIYSYIDFDWYLARQDKKPTVSFYSKNGKEYLVVSQFFKTTELTSEHTISLYLIKEKKSDWKVYDVKYN